MPTTVDRFFAVVDICQNLSTMQNNMRANVVVIQTSAHAGTLTVTAQKAFSDLGIAFNQRLSMNSAIMAAFPAQLSAGATAIGVAPADVTSVQALLVTWAENLRLNTVVTLADCDTLVTNILAAVPAAMLPF